MSQPTEKYVHHGAEVNVFSHFKGQHRSVCLCYECKFFAPEPREENCPIAEAVYENCIKYNLTTPICECPKFEQK